MTCVCAQTLGGAEASTAGPHPNKTDYAHTALNRALAASARSGEATPDERGGPVGNANERFNTLSRMKQRVEDIICDFRP